MGVEALKCQREKSDRTEGALGPKAELGGAGRKEGPVVSRGRHCQVWFCAPGSDLGLAVKGTLGDC